jgi:hypothetical protein
MSVPSELYEDLDRRLASREEYYPRHDEPEWSGLQAALARVTEALWEGARREPDRRPPAGLEAFADSPVFVLGYYKSGTTLMLDLLDGHPELLALPGESRHFTSFVREDGDPIRRLHALWIRNTVTPYGLPPRWLLGKPEPGADPYDAFGRDLVAYARARGQRDLLATAAQALAVATGREPRRWVEKTPTHELQLAPILAAYPNARFVHIVRDPRSTVDSISHYESEEPIVDALTAAAELARSFDAALSGERRLGDRYTVVRYEDLVADPASTMTRVAAALDVANAQSLTIPTTFGAPATANAGRLERRVSGAVHALSLDGASRLGRRDRAVVEALAGRRARALGYDTGTGSAAVALAARAALSVRYRIGRR